MKQMKRVLALLLCGAMLLGNIPATVFAVDDQGLCEHHQEHIGCSHTPAVAAVECGHQHAEVCGMEGETCFHVHDEECGYAEAQDAVACDYVCTDCEKQEDLVSCDGTLSCEAEKHSGICEKKLSDDRIAAEQAAAEKAAAEQAAADQAAADAVQAMIDDLCSLEEIQKKPVEEQQVDYLQVQDVYEAYCALTEEQQVLLSPAEDIFRAYFDFFNGQVSAAATSGTCGDNAKWYVNGKTLVIYGSGDMYDYEVDTAPWESNIASGTSAGANITSIQIGDGITSIGDYAFYNNLAITDISIGSGVQRIGEYSCQFDQVETLELPESLTEIEEYAFAWCFNLKEVNLPESLKVMGSGCFYGCESLTTIHIPKGVEEFPLETTIFQPSAFANCSGITAFTVDSANPILASQDGVLFNKDMTYLLQYPLSSVNTAYTIPESVTTIGYNAFGGSKNLKTITVPASVKKIEEYAFASIPSLEEVTFCGNVPELVESYIFNNNTVTVYYPVGDTTWSSEAFGAHGGIITWTPIGLKGEIVGTHGENVIWKLNETTGVLTISGTGAISKVMSGHAYPWGSYLDSITAVVVESGITEIPAYTFEYMESAESIILPNTLKTLSLNAFNDCGALNNLMIPASVQTIDGSSNTGYPAFIRCESLTDVYYLGTEQEWLSIPNAGFVVNSYAEMTMHFLVLHENPPTCMESGTQSYYSFDDTSVYNNLYDLEKNVITELEIIPKLNHEWGIDQVCQNCGIIGGSAGGVNTSWTLDSEGTLTVWNNTCWQAVFNYRHIPWYDQRAKIKTAVVADGVTGIANYAFYDCDNLKTITIPDSIIRLYEYAFYGCSSLSDIKLPDGVTQIGQYAFFGCSSLSSINLPDGITEIGQHAFYGCSSLSGIDLPNGITSIEYNTFNGCSDLASITIPDGVKYIGNSAFSRCSALTEVVIPESVISFGNNSAFKECSKLVSINIPAGVTEIGNSTFQDCSSLTDITIHDGVTKIGYDAFKGCSSLSSITLPKNITSVERSTFEGCSNLDSVILPENLVSIGENAFHQCSSLVEIRIPESVVSIGNQAFYQCAALESIALPDSVTSVGDYAFRECNSLTEITLSKKLTKIGDCVFYDCSELCSIVIPDGVISIGGNAFYGCSSLNSVTIPDSVTSIDGMAFAGCGSLTSVAIPDSVTSLGGYAFKKCSKLTTITLPSNIISIGNSVFYECKSLTNVTIPENVASIGAYAFFRCNLDSILLPDGVTDIGSYAFCECDNLQIIDLPASLVNIGAQVFAWCQNLDVIVFNGDAPQFDEKTFAGISTTAYYPANNPTWTADVLQDYGGNITWLPDGAVKNRVTVYPVDLSGQTAVWIDGVEYTVQTDDSGTYVDLPDGSARTMAIHTYNSTSPNRYPTGMKVWMLENEDGIYTATRQEAFDDILQYSGMSIRVTGKKGIRMVTGIEQEKKNALISGGLGGYTLKEYGTVVAWASKLTDGNPLTLGQSYAMSNYAYKKGVADPVFAYSGSLMQYTNVLVNFSDEQCKYDLALRPYMILEDEEGAEVTLYGGIVNRSIGYIAYQNRNEFEPGTEEYNYIWDIIRYVYGDVYDDEFEHAWTTPKV